MHNLPNTVYCLFLQIFNYISGLQVVFKTRIYHCNVDSAGNLSVDILKDSWSPALTISNVLLAIRSIFTKPDPCKSFHFLLSIHVFFFPFWWMGWEGVLSVCVHHYVISGMWFLLVCSSFQPCSLFLVEEEKVKHSCQLLWVLIGIWKGSCQSHILNPKNLKNGVSDGTLSSDTQHQKTLNYADFVSNVLGN